jgi:hypothetical protein
LKEIYWPKICEIRRSASIGISLPGTLTLSTLKYLQCT